MDGWVGLPDCLTRDWPFTSPDPECPVGGCAYGTCHDGACCCPPGYFGDDCSIVCI